MTRIVKYLFFFILLLGAGSTRDVRPANSSENQWLVTFGRSA